MESSKVIYSEGGPDSEVGAALASLEETIRERMAHDGAAGYEDSYTCKLLNGPLDSLLKKITEEAVEVALASKDVEAAYLYGDSNDGNDADAASNVGGAANADGISGISDTDDASNGISQLEAHKDHLRYEAADLIYHLLVLLESYDICIDELAAELNSRMRDDERPPKCALITREHINRGK